MGGVKNLWWSFKRSEILDMKTTSALNKKTLSKKTLNKKTLSIVVPGSLVREEQLEQAVRRVEALGFSAHVPKPEDLPFILQGFLKESLSEEEFLKKKFSHLKRAFTSRDSDAIWCVRGGYGSQKLMPFLMKMKCPSRKKIFIGYSDVTVIHTYLNRVWKWPSFHFPVLADLKGISTSSLQRFKNGILDIKKGGQSFLGLEVLNKNKFKGSICASITGGNLTLLQTSIGTPWECSFRGKILFLEDVGEPAYRIDRALWQMLSAGVFKGVKACVLGEFSGSDKTRLKEVFKSFASRVSFPVVTGIPSGHGKAKELVPFLTPASLNFYPTQKAQLIFT